MFEKNALPKKSDMPEIFEPKYLNLHDLTGYIKAHLGGLVKGSNTERDNQWGKAWIAELIQRLAEIKKELRRGSINTRLSWALAVALRKTAIESGFIVEQEWQTFSQGSSIINKIRRSFQSLLKNHPQANKRAQRLKLFCEILCQEMPYEERFVPGPVVLEIKIPPSSRANWMADGQAGEAD